MPYRDATEMPRVTLASFTVFRARGSHATALLAVTAGVSAFVGGIIVAFIPEPAFEGWIVPVVWLYFAVAVATAIAAIWLRMQRRRTLSFVRVGDRIELVVSGYAVLVFPLAVSTVHHDVSDSEGEYYELHLELVDRADRVLRLAESIRKLPPEWPVARPPVPTPDLRTNQLLAIRAWIEAAR